MSCLQDNPNCEVSQRVVSSVVSYFTVFPGGYAPVEQVMVTLRIFWSKANEQVCPLIVSVPVQPTRGAPLTTQSRCVSMGADMPGTEIVASVATPFASVWTVMGSG